MEFIDLILSGIALLLFGFLGGMVLSVNYTTHLIKSGKRVPRYLRDVGVKMPGS